MFIWTISDAVNVVILGAVILFFAVCFAIIGFEKLWSKLCRAFGVQRR